MGFIRWEDCFVCSLNLGLASHLPLYTGLRIRRFREHSGAVFGWMGRFLLSAVLFVGIC